MRERGIRDEPSDQWWLFVVAAHNHQRPRTHLTDTDAATLARWRSLGASDAFIRQTLEQTLDADTERRLYALAYCDHALRKVLTGQKHSVPRAASSGRGSFRFGMRSAEREADKVQSESYDRAPGSILSIPGVEDTATQEFIGKHIPFYDTTMLSTPPCSSPAPAAPEPTSAWHPVVPPTTSRIYCSKCFRSFLQIEDDPCLRSMSVVQRRIWAEEHKARYHHSRDSVPTRAYSR